jgi:hypothetical protein
MTHVRNLNLDWVESISSMPLDLEHISAMTALQRLVIWADAGPDGDGEDSSIAGVALLTRLHHLSLDACNTVTECGMQPLAALEQLTSLYLARSQHVSAAGLAGLAWLLALTSLQELSLTAFTCAGDDGLAHVAALNALQVLSISG